MVAFVRFARKRHTTFRLSVATTGNPLSFQRGADLSVLLHKKRRQYFVY
jgi:hypothetical protein